MRIVDAAVPEVAARLSRAVPSGAIGSEVVQWWGGIVWRDRLQKARQKGRVVAEGVPDVSPVFSTRAVPCILVGSRFTYRTLNLLRIAFALLLHRGVIREEAFQEFAVVAAGVVGPRALTYAELPPGPFGLFRKSLYLFNLLDQLGSRIPIVRAGHAG